MLDLSGADVLSAFDPADVEHQMVGADVLPALNPGY